MTKVATRAPRLGDLIQYEEGQCVGFCRKTVTVNEAAETEYKIGRVLGVALAAGATAAAVADAGNTGDGTVSGEAAAAPAVPGEYKIIIEEADTDAGDFRVIDPAGNLVGYGVVGTVFEKGGLVFTLADGAADFVAGDFFVLTVTGTLKYKTLDIEAADGSDKFAGIYIGGAGPQAVNSQTVAAATDTQVVILYRGPAAVGKDLLTYAASVDTAAERAKIEAQINNAGIKVLDQPNQLA